MKYSFNTQVEELLVGSLPERFHHIINHYISGTLNILECMFRHINHITRMAFSFSKVVVYNYFSNSFNLNEQDAFESYKFTHHHGMPYRVWSRHSAFLSELEECDHLTDTPICENSNMEQCYKSGPLHINVKAVKAIPVWSSNLDDIGIIHN